MAANPDSFDLTPSVGSYAKVLNMIISNSTRRADREFASGELIAIQPALAANKWSTK